MAEPLRVPSSSPCPTPREIASGVVTGAAEVTDAAPPPEHSPAPPPEPLDPLAAVERAVLPALCRPPCVVSFSGGMDSSFVLAVATRVARRHGLPVPVPVSWHFADAPRAEESIWQDRVLAALMLPDRIVLRAVDELDVLGPVAGRVLLRHGVVHPPNAHLHLPVAEIAAGGTVLTGYGGDQVLAGWRRPAHPFDPRPATRRARSALRRRRAAPDPFPWLHPAAGAAVLHALRAERRSEPARASARPGWHAGRREPALVSAALAAVAAGVGAELVSPLLDPGFVAALSVHLGHGRPPTRSRLLAGITAGAFPPVVSAPRPKAGLLEVFLREPSREFARDWDGTGVVQQEVDIRALRGLWRRDPLPAGTAGLLQQAWLAAIEVRSRPAPDQPGTSRQGRR